MPYGKNSTDESAKRSPKLTPEQQEHTRREVRRLIEEGIVIPAPPEPPPSPEEQDRIDQEEF